MHRSICLLNDISIMHYVQFGSNTSPDYVMPADTPRHVKPYIVVFAFWISEYMAIAVESVEMGGGGGRLTAQRPRPIMFLAWRLCACDDIESRIHVYRSAFNL